MNKEDYEKAKAECWKSYCEAYPCVSSLPHARKSFEYAFGHACSLGKQKKISLEGDSISPKKDIELACNHIFGSNCLPDNVDSLSQNPPENCDNGNLISTDDNKPAEPKFKVGDKVMYKGVLRVIDLIDTVTHRYHLSNGNYYAEWVDESDLEPYTDPDTSHETPVFENHSDNASQKEVNVNSNRNLSQNIAICDKQFDTILKDSFRNEHRLNIGTQIISAILSNQEMLNNIASGETTAEGIIKCVVDTTMIYTDALIAECEKGGSDGN